MADYDKKIGDALTSSIERLRHELDHWMEVAVSKGEQAWDTVKPLVATDKWRPAINILETAEQVLVTADLPGISPTDVDVSLTGNMLTIKGSRAADEVPEGSQLHLSQRPVGTFEVAVPMPVVVDAQQVSASMKEGVLHVELVRSAQDRPRQIPINANTNSPTASA